MTGTAVITGMGVAAPNGVGAEEFWAATLAGRTGIARVSHFDPGGYPAVLAGEVPSFEAADHLPSRLLPQTDRMTQLALAAADWALADAGIRPQALPEFEMGVITASSSGGFAFGQRELQNLWSRGPQYVSAYQSFAWFYAVNSGQISIRNGMKGPSGVVVSDQAGGLDAIAQARRQIRKGTPVIVTGGIDASICPWGWVAQQAGGGLSTVTEPAAAYLPFDTRARGYVPGEGGAILIAESQEHARARDARIYGEIAGYAATFDSGGAAGRSATAAAIELALADARLRPGAIDVVFADAAGLPEPDRAEAEAISSIFGPHGVAVTAPKTMTGRLCSGGAPLDVAGALLAMADNVIPPTVNVEVDAGHRLDLVTTVRSTRIRAVLVLARGYGGFNSAMVLRAAE